MTDADDPFETVDRRSERARDGIDRREALRRIGLAAGGAGLAVGGGLWWRSRGDAPPTAVDETDRTLAIDPSRTTTSTQAAPSDTQPAPTTAATDPRSSPGSADPKQRLLVIIELAGGMDGLSLAPPIGNGAYFDLRPTTGIDPLKALEIADGVALHPGLARLHRRPFALLQGLGARTPDESHFEMMRRWHTGDPDGTRTPATGIWGRLADAIGDRSMPATAMTVGSGPHPAMRSANVPTISLSGPDQASYFADGTDGTELLHAFRKGMAGLQSAGGAGLEARFRGANRSAGDLAARLETLDADRTGQVAVTYPGTRLGQSLQFAAKLLHGDLGTRIVHVPMNEDFDTHQFHNVRFDILMADLDAALDAFLTDLEQRGLSDRVVVATVSEFGRRAGENYSGGLDHGTANNMLLFGRVRPGLHGQYASLTDLDYGNLKATSTFEQYYAALAGDWLGADVSDVIPGASPLTGLFS